MDYAASYGEMHANGKYFPGFSIAPYVPAIAALVDEHHPNRMLDYGCGRGLQYLKRRVHEEWGGLLPYCYDIGVKGLHEKPEGTFDGVLCVDVLEHIERVDIPDVLDELIAYTDEGGFVFLVISCRPTKKRLPDGRDVHVTIEPPSWWHQQFANAAARNQRRVKLVAHFDVAGHFDEPEEPWEGWLV